MLQRQEILSVRQQAARRAFGRRPLRPALFDAVRRVIDRRRLSGGTAQPRQPIDPVVRPVVDSGILTGAAGAAQLLGQVAYESLFSACLESAQVRLKEGSYPSIQLSSGGHGPVRGLEAPRAPAPSYTAKAEMDRDERLRSSGAMAPHKREFGVKADRARPPT